MKILIATIALPLLAASSLFAQESRPPLVTDRPDQSESPTLIPQGGLQIETGALATWGDDGVESYTLNTILLRYGLGKYLEVRLTNNLVHVPQNFTGITPLGIGAKILVREPGKGWVPGIAFLGNLNLHKVATTELQAENIAPSFRFLATSNLSEDFSLGYNLGMEWDGSDPKGRGLYTLSLGWAATDALAVFVESYGYFTFEESEHLMDAGITWLLAPRFQLDASAGLRFQEGIKMGFVSFGASWRMFR